jgi:L-lactate dehydrogenase complex protein LldG
MSSREQILGRLRQRKERPFPASEPPQTHQPVVPPGDQSPAALRARFIEEARKAGCIVHEAGSPEAAIAVILEIVGEDTAVSAWDPAHIPLPGLAEALDKANISRVEQDAGARVGLTGVDAALAATGSVVVVSGDGRIRAASLLPPVHIAVVAAGQIMPDLESWWSAQKEIGLEQIRRHSNVVVITGPSRTADIAMQLVMGMHGPRELHLALLADL